MQYFDKNKFQNPDWGQGTLKKVKSGSLQDFYDLGVIRNSEHNLEDFKNDDGSWDWKLIRKVAHIEKSKPNIFKHSREDYIINKWEARYL